MYQYQELTPFFPFLVGFPSVEGEFLASRLPAEFFDEELGQVALLQERVGEGEVRWH
jgi:hypothetical protein